jgi:hypothetical protein
VGTRMQGDMVPLSRKGVEFCPLSRCSRGKQARLHDKSIYNMSDCACCCPPLTRLSAG